MDDKTNPISLSNDSLSKNSNTSISSIATPKLIVAFIAVILLGVGVGYVFSNIGNKNSSNKVESGSNIPGSKNVVGSSDTKTFKDIAEGTLKLGGIDGEGAYHLSRPGGDSQNVYLTSSIVDLSAYVGKKIKVWGETQQAEKAGWLMDVGRIEVLQ